MKQFKNLNERDSKKKLGLLFIGLLGIGESFFALSKSTALQSQAFFIDGKTGATPIARQFKKEKQFPFEVVQLLYAGSKKGIGRAFEVIEEENQKLRFFHPKVHFFDRAYELEFNAKGECIPDSLTFEKHTTSDFVSKMKIILIKKGEKEYEIRFKNPQKNQNFDIKFITREAIK